MLTGYTVPFNEDITCSYLGGVNQFTMGALLVPSGSDDIICQYYLTFRMSYFLNLHCTANGFLCKYERNTMVL